MSSLLPIHSESDLPEEQRGELSTAHGELRSAVAAYEIFLSREVRHGEEPAVLDASELRSAQEKVESAENALWQLREKFLGWTRPSWAPSATLVADWILEDDPGYDNESDSARH